MGHILGSIGEVILIIGVIELMFFSVLPYRRAKKKSNGMIIAYEE